MAIYLAGEILICPKLIFMYIVPVDAACDVVGITTFLCGMYL